MAATRALLPAEQERLLDALERERDRLLVLTGLLTGYRIAEILSLRICDVYRNGQPVGEITVARRQMKGGEGVFRRRVRGRTVILQPVLRAAIQGYIERRFAGDAVQPQTALFLSKKGGAISYVQAYRIIKAAASAIGDADRVATHSMRKTFVRAVYDNSGHDLILTQRAVGHSSIATTGRYLESTDDEVRSAVLGIAAPGNLGRFAQVLDDASTVPAAEPFKLCSTG